jgi:hypothetical protein
MFETANAYIILLSGNFPFSLMGLLVASSPSPYHDPLPQYYPKRAYYI